MTDDQAAEPIEDQVTELDRKVSTFAEGLRKTRRSLDADEFASLASPRARLEVPLDSVDAYLFTVDGVLQGEKLTGCLLYGECMLVRAKTEREAVDLANAGLRSTVKALYEEYETRELRGGVFGSDFVSVEAGGRRGQANEGEPLLKMPELRAMLERAFKLKE